MTTPLPRPIDAVLFDFSGTLFAVELPQRWLRAAAATVGVQLDPAQQEALTGLLLAAGRPGGPEPHAVPPGLADTYARRDLSPETHRSAYVGLLSTVDLPHPGLAEALYDRLFRTDGWLPYRDAAPVLAELRRRGVGTAVVSNIAWDLRPTFAAYGMAELVDAYVFSHEVGAVKPDPRIFRTACDELKVAPERALMVGDTLTDGGAVHAGLQTLLLPASPPDTVHGLAAVLELVGGEPAGPAFPEMTDA
ncbi:HAD family hydrolase [Micromonospora sp. KC207]|uniref:HAD family hydrolase n=1 Tax=Micromonospora sp. KC207 TaxID=2530377 RepID=UPI00104C0526|nr:HAD-IA family hydrolase [Micromonospora sp. KC207]TDC67372.1 HAD family hydrolase [Micromonospora sp. KC207]